MDTALLKKMSYKGESPLLLANVPDTLLDTFKDWIKESVAQDHDSALNYAFVFVQKQEDLNQWIDKLCPLMEGDAPLWFAYPKKSSKRFKSEITRDSGWNHIGQYNMEPVRQIAIDEDWSALRFRKLEFIKKLTRRDSMRLSPKK